MKKKYDFPVYKTEFGGLVRETKEAFVFLEKPKVSGYETGDKMPSDWTLYPANEAARIEKAIDECYLS